MRPIFKTKMLVYQSKANLDGEILFDKITHLLGPKIRKMLIRRLCGNQKFHVPFWSMIYVALKFALQFSEIEFDFNSR